MSILDKLFKKAPQKQSKEDIALINSIEKNDLQTIKQVLEAGANPNAYDMAYVPAILLASTKQQIEVVEWLIDKGADVNAKGTNAEAGVYELSPLIAASANGCIEIVRMLLKQKANPNIKEKTGMTALMTSSYKNHYEIVELLLQNGADVNIKDMNGEYPLMFAANKGSLECAKLLIENGADVNARAKEGSTPILYAAQHGYLSTVKLLVEKGADVNAVGIHRRTALDLAKQNNKIETIEYIEQFSK